MYTFMTILYNFLLKYKILDYPLLQSYMIRYICKQFKFSYTYPMRVISPTEMRAVKILEMLPIFHFLDRSQICDFLVKYDINIIKLFTKSQICLYTQLFCNWVDVYTRIEGCTYEVNCFCKTICNFIVKHFSAGFER